jgi:hypothetical protein
MVERSISPADPIALANPSVLGQLRSVEIQASLVSVAKCSLALKNAGLCVFFFGVFWLTCTCALWHTYDMKQAKSESPSDIVRWLQSEAASLWPAILGSLSLRRSPCVRENCPACLSGEQHQSYVLYSRLNGRRFAVYVPEELVPELRRCVDNGRALQELLQEAAPRYVKALKRERANTSKSKKS